MTQLTFFLLKMAIAAATLEYIAAKVQCKTLFITHYPLLATKLESKFPSKIQNLHMGYMAEQRLSGIREITFLYRLTLGLSKGMGEANNVLKSLI